MENRDAITAAYELATEQLSRAIEMVSTPPSHQPCTDTRQRILLEFSAADFALFEEGCRVAAVQHPGGSREDDVTFIIRQWLYLRRQLTDRR